MKRILLAMLILVVSIVFTACSDSKHSEQIDNEKVQTNEEVVNEAAEEIAEEEEIVDFQGGRYTDEATGAITITIPSEFVPSEDTVYSTADTVATVTVKPQEPSSETLSSFLLIQIIEVENAGGYAETYINTFAKDNENVNEVEIAGLKGFSISSEDEITGWNNENYVLIGPQSIDYMVLIMGYGWGDSYLEDVHSIIYTLEIDFDKL